LPAGTSCRDGRRRRIAKVGYEQYFSAHGTQTAMGRSVVGIIKTSDAKRAFGQTLKRRHDIVNAFLSDLEKWDSEFAKRLPAERAAIAKRHAMYVGASGVYAAVCPDSPDCSASRSAIARDVRSRSKIAATTPPTTTITSAIQEKRVSQRSAAMPA
jgi:hypothetical protein